MTVCYIPNDLWCHLFPNEHSLEDPFPKATFLSIRGQIFVALSVSQVKDNFFQSV